MAQPTVTITHSSLTPNTKVIQCQHVTLGGKRKVDGEPWANAGGATEVHVMAFENQRFSVNQVFFDTESQTARPELLTEDDVQTLNKLFYDGTNAPTLSVSYGMQAQKNLKALNGATNIPVILEGFSIPIDMRDSKNGYLPTGNLTFIETING